MRACWLLALFIFGLSLRNNYGLLAMSATSVVPRGQVLGPWWTDKRVLNPSCSVSEDGSSQGAVSAAALAKSLRMSMLGLKSQFMSDDGSSVNYEALRESEAFKEYVKLTADLRKIDLGDLPPPARRAFLINVYNCLCIHALTEGLLSSFPGGSLSRLKLYAKSSYQIGGDVYSLNDIENGVLRNNKPSAAPWAKNPFDEGDPKLAFCIDCDPRIHFALNCAANSCPPIAVYDVEDSDKFDRQLDLATKGFLGSKSNVLLDKAKKTAELSMLFQWYASDFTDSGDDKGLLEWLMKNGDEHTKAEMESFLGSLEVGESPTLKYFVYDWAVNSS